MRIICKEKDYYDFLQDQTDDVIFDRRNYWRLRDVDILDCVHINPWMNNNIVLGIRAGYHIFLFRIKLINAEISRCHLYSHSNLKYDIEYIGERIDYEYSGKNYINIISYDLHAGYNRKFKAIEHDIMTVNLNNIEQEVWDYGNPKKHAVQIPFFADTFIPKYVPAEAMYRGIDDYIRASKNDVTQESAGLTDVEKVINHGFDKKMSFRNVK